MEPECGYVIPRYHHERFSHSYVADDACRCVAIIQEPPLEGSERGEVLVTAVQWISSVKYGRLLMVAYMFHGLQ